MSGEFKASAPNEEDKGTKLHSVKPQTEEQRSAEEKLSYARSFDQLIEITIDFTRSVNRLVKVSYVVLSMQLLSMFAMFIYILLRIR